ncbi:hypothetical protein AMR41_20005 [Hapalosiphon sp. MRB220]|nr:hypothetical protein AMR41_20005 [Hapalosiphon sp. MRB220]
MTKNNRYRDPHWRSSGFLFTVNLSRTAITMLSSFLVGGGFVYFSQQQHQTQSAQQIASCSLKQQPQMEQPD